MAKGKAMIALLGLGAVGAAAFYFGMQKAEARPAEGEPALPPGTEPPWQPETEAEKLNALYQGAMVYPQFFTHGELEALADILDANGMASEAEQVRDIAAYYYGPDPSGEGPGKLADYLATGDHNTLPVITQEVIDQLGDFPEPFEPVEPAPPDLTQTTPGVWPGIPEGGFQYGPEIPEGWDFTQGPAPGIPWPEPPEGYQWPPIEWYFPVPDPNNPFLPPEGLPPVIIWTPITEQPELTMQPFSEPERGPGYVDLEASQEALANQQLIAEYLTALESPVGYTLGDPNRGFDLIQALNAAGFTIEADMFGNAMMQAGLISQPPPGWEPTTTYINPPGESVHGSHTSPYGTSPGRFPV